MRNCLPVNNLRRWLFVAKNSCRDESRRDKKRSDALRILVILSGAKNLAPQEFACSIELPSPFRGLSSSEAKEGAGGGASQRTIIATRGLGLPRN